MIRLQALNCKSIKGATYKTVELVNSKGKTTIDERGDKVRYYKHAVIVIPCECCEDSDDLLTFICGFEFGRNLITGKPSGTGIQAHVYTYGEELHKNNGLDHTIEILKKSPGTRRAVNPLFKPEHYEKEDVPCMVILNWDIEEEDGEDVLNLTIFGRSNEVAIAMKTDLKGFSYLLEYVAFQVGVKPGEIMLHDVNAHVRVDSDGDEINRILKAGLI